MEKENSNALAEVNPQFFKSLIHEIRGTLVMLDADLAAIYGYSTKAFNQQISRNIERFDEEDFMFQLNEEETRSLRFDFSTSNEDDSSENLKSQIVTSNRGGRRYAPYAFTEQGVYMLMAVLKGPKAVKQSKALMRLFRQMKDYIVQNQSLLGEREYLQLSMQTTENVREIMGLRASLNKLDDKVAKMADEMGQVVTKSQLANVLLDFGEPAVRRGWLILNGQPVESDLAYKQIYSSAKQSIILIDDYINLKTLALVRDVPEGVSVTVLSDNAHGYLHEHEVEDFRKEFPDLKLTILFDGGIFHDRYIVLDYGTEKAVFYHCGSSSKDGGNKVMSITLIEDSEVYYPLIDRALKNTPLKLK